jgi:hypothetical protein
LGTPDAPRKFAVISIRALLTIVAKAKKRAGFEGRLK